MPTVGARRHAEKVASWGVDAVIAQGGEGGGHTGTGPTTPAAPQVVDAVDIPVLAAGGFLDGRGLVAALAYGAAGVAMGTRFLLSAESTVPDAVQAALPRRVGHRHGRDHRVDGYPQRVIRTELVDHLEGAGPDHRAARGARERAAVPEAERPVARRPRRGRPGDEEEPGPDLGAGRDGGQRADAAPRPRSSTGASTPACCRPARSSGVIDELPTVADIIGSIMEEAEATLTRLEGRRERDQQTARSSPAPRAGSRWTTAAARVARRAAAPRPAATSSRRRSRSRATRPRRPRSSRRSRSSRRRHGVVVDDEPLQAARAVRRRPTRSCRTRWSRSSSSRSRWSCSASSPPASTADDLDGRPGRRARRSSTLYEDDDHEYVVWKWRPREHAANRDGTRSRSSGSACTRGASGAATSSSTASSAARAALADAGVEWSDIQFVSGGETVRNGYPGYVAGATFAQALGWHGRAGRVVYAACASGATALERGAGADPRRPVRCRARRRRRHHAEGLPRPERRGARRRPRLAAVPPARRDQPDVLRALRAPPHGAASARRRRLRQGQGEERRATGSTTRTRATARK